MEGRLVLDLNITTKISALVPKTQVGGYSLAELGPND